MLGTSLFVHPSVLRSQWFNGQNLGSVEDINIFILTMSSKTFFYEIITISHCDTSLGMVSIDNHLLFDSYMYQIMPTN